MLVIVSSFSSGFSGKNRRGFKMEGSVKDF